MKKGDIYIEKIEKTSFPDIALIKKADNEIEVKKAIEGQTVEIIIKKKKKNKASGRILKVIERSPLQTRLGCELDEKCGGCLYQSLEYKNQLEIKEKQMKELLLKANKSKDFIWEGIVPSPKYLAYRNKMEYSFGDDKKGGVLNLGLHKQASTYDILNTDMCQIVNNDFNIILKESLDFFRSKNLPHYHKMKHEGFLRHLLIRRSENKKEILVDLISTTSLEKQPDPNTVNFDLQNFSMDKILEDIIKEWADLIYSLNDKNILEARIVGILHTKNNSYADAILNQGTRILYGRDYIKESICGLEFKISIFSFFQTNSLAAEKLYEKVGEYIKGTHSKAVFDLYSGTGTIAQILSKYADEIYAVEIIEEAVEAAKENAKLNNIDNCKFIAGDVLKVIDSLDIKPEIMILDPPRDGIHIKALPKLINFDAKQIVYIACKPSSFARDLITLKEAGYKLKKAVAVDMFPFTPNCELVALLKK